MFGRCFGEREGGGALSCFFFLFSFLWTSERVKEKARKSATLAPLSLHWKGKGKREKRFLRALSDVFLVVFFFFPPHLFPLYRPSLSLLFLFFLSTEGGWSLALFLLVFISRYVRDHTELCPLYAHRALVPARWEEERRDERR